MTLAELSQRVGRADFLDGLGVYVGPHEVALAHVRKRLFQVTLVATETRPLPGPDRAAERPAALAAAVEAFARERGVDVRRTCLCLPRAEAAFSRALLPAAARENLQQVIEFELENLVPLPRDDVYFDWAVRDAGEERIQVLLVCVPRAVVQGYLDALDGVGIKPRAIGLASTAIADYLAFCRGQTPGPYGVLVGSTGGIEFAVASGERLLASQLLGGPRIADGTVVERAIGRELAEAAAGTDVPVFRWQLATNGAAPPLPEVGDGNLLALAEGRLEAPPAFFAGGEPALLPAVGAALAAVREGTIGLNLLPGERRAAIESGIGLATFVLVAVVGVLLLVWGASAMVKDELLLQQVRRQVDELAPKVAATKKVQDEIDDLERQLSILTAGQDQRITVLLKELTAAVPNDAYLTSVNIRSSNPQQAGAPLRLTIDGQATKASDLIQQLEKSKNFKNVTFTSPTTRSGDKERFSLVAEVER